MTAAFSVIANKLFSLVAMALMRFYFSFPLSDTTTRNEFNLVEKFLKQSAGAGALSKMKTTPAEWGEIRALIPAWSRGNPAGLSQTSFTTPQ
jgi:phage-related protein